MSEHDERPHRTRHWVARFAAHDGSIFAQARILHAKISDFSWNSGANDVAQANYVAFSQARIDSFIRLRPRYFSPAIRRS